MIADAHNDLLLELAFRRREQNPFGNHWLRQLRAGDVTSRDELDVPLVQDPIPVVLAL